MVTTEEVASPEVQIKEEIMESDSDTVDTVDTVDTQTDLSSCPSSPTPTTSPPPPTTHTPLPMDTVILVSKCPDGSRSSLVFRSLLRNRKVPGRVEKIRIVKSPVTEIKHASLPMRTNLKQQLQRHQLLDQERRQSYKSGSHTISTTGSTGINVPRVVEATPVPTNVLQVKTQLQHPTKYHVRQSQKRQVQNFLTEHHNGSHPIQSLPANVISISSLDQSGQQQHQQYAQTSSSAPEPDLPSPLMQGSASADFLPSEYGLLSDVSSIDQFDVGSLLGDSDLVEIQPSLGSSYTNEGFLPGLDNLTADSPTAANNNSSNSCPTNAFHHTDITQTGIMSVQDEMWRKERIKKDNHNMIERRRRFNINDRIKELGGLLPRSIDPDLRQNKGTILKASVDYIKSLQDEQRKFKMMIDEKRRTEMDLRKVLLKVNQMQLVMKSHGIGHTGLDDLELTSSFSSMANDFLTSTAMMPVANIAPPTSTASPNFLTTSPVSVSIYSQMDELMDESSPVSGDPMLMSSPVSPETEEQTFGFGFGN